MRLAKLYILLLPLKYLKETPPFPFREMLTMYVYVLYVCLMYFPLAETYLLSLAFYCLAGIIIRSEFDEKSLITYTNSFSFSISLANFQFCFALVMTADMTDPSHL